MTSSTGKGGIMKRALYACVSVWILIFLLNGCAIAPKKPDQILPGNYAYAKEYLTWLIQKEMKKNQVMGLSIAIVDDQTIVWKRGFGYADAKLRIPATPETVYRIGSISKLFSHGPACTTLVTSWYHAARPICANQRPPAELGVRGWSLEGTGALATGDR